MKTDNRKELPVISFESGDSWEEWLGQNHDTSSGIWLRFFKKGSGIRTIVYAEAVDVALCYGWIDGQAKSCDENSYFQRFTPRRPRSIWSKRNIGNVMRLEEAGKMKKAGLKAVEAAKADGRWDQAYDSPVNMSAPDDFVNELKKDPKAFAFFESLNKTNKYAIGWRLQTAKKAETREKRMKQIIELLSNEKKIHE
jgi:uncharacterized protein YdeI (YjbR/CyaY-like superfamily)